jgi:hypothetical protein
VSQAHSGKAALVRGASTWHPLRGLTFRGGNHWLRDLEDFGVFVECLKAMLTKAFRARTRTRREVPCRPTGRYLSRPDHSADAATSVADRDTLTRWRNMSTSHNPPRRHLAPSQAGGGQEPDHLGLRSGGYVFGSLSKELTLVSTGPTHRAEAHQSGTCTCPETVHTSVAAADLGHNRRHYSGRSVRRAATRDPGTGRRRHPNHRAGRCR